MSGLSECPRRPLPFVLLAWVLWAHTQVSVPERGLVGPGTWTPLEGQETKAACEAALGGSVTRMIGRAEARGQKADLQDDRLVISEPSGGGPVFTHRLTCFPDGTDPRPKE